MDKKLVSDKNYSNLFLTLIMCWSVLTDVTIVTIWEMNPKILENKKCEFVYTQLWLFLFILFEFAMFGMVVSVDYSEIDQVYKEWGSYGSLWNMELYGSLKFPQFI